MQSEYTASGKYDSCAVCGARATSCMLFIRNDEALCAKCHCEKYKPSLTLEE